mmetsp:Transcript_45416/g.109392  ORF Transcript_45416/g.109392 Transcript_45416/m.109392 type:complete len:200 (-) Transcript_45416:91-690(-)
MISSIQSYDDDIEWGYYTGCCNCAKAVGWQNYGSSACQYCKDRVKNTTGTVRAEKESLPVFPKDEDILKPQAPASASLSEASDGEASSADEAQDVVGGVEEDGKSELQGPGHSLQQAELSREEEEQAARAIRADRHHGRQLQAARQEAAAERAKAESERMQLEIERERMQLENVRLQQQGASQTPQAESAVRSSCCTLS